MTNKIISLFIFGLSFPFATSYGQVKETIISGKVICGDDLSPLEGVTILVKGTKNITGTMIDGDFTLSVTKKDSILIASLNDYETKEVRITNDTYYEITLKHEARQLHATYCKEPVVPWIVGIGR